MRLNTNIPAKYSSWYQRRFLRGGCLHLSRRVSGCVPSRSPRALWGPLRAFQWTRSLWWLLWFLWCRSQPRPGHCYWFGNPIGKKTFTSIILWKIIPQRSDKIHTEPFSKQVGHTVCYKVRPHTMRASFFQDGTLEEEAELEMGSNGAGPCVTDTQTGRSERPKELNYSLARGFNFQAISVSQSIIFCSDISVTSVKCFKLPSNFFL